MSNAQEPEFVVRPFWATHFYIFRWREHEAEAPGLVELVYRLRAEQQGLVASGVARAAKSAAGLAEGDFDLFKRPEPGIRKLAAFAARSVRVAASHVNGSELPPERLTVSIPDAWFHVTNGGGFHDAHHHGGCSWCGIYYLQAGEAGNRAAEGAPNGGNRFYSPIRSGGAHTDYGNKYLDSTYVDPPIRDGMLLLFPSYLLHSALPYTGKVDRIVISFNSSVGIAPEAPRQAGPAGVTIGSF